MQTPSQADRLASLTTPTDMSQAKGHSKKNASFHNQLLEVHPSSPTVEMRSQRAALAVSGSGESAGFVSKFTIRPGDICLGGPVCGRNPPAAGPLGPIALLMLLFNCSFSHCSCSHMTCSLLLSSTCFFVCLLHGRLLRKLP